MEWNGSGEAMVATAAELPLHLLDAGGWLLGEMAVVAGQMATAACSLVGPSGTPRGGKKPCVRRRDSGYQSTDFTAKVKEHLCDT